MPRKDPSVWSVPRLSRLLAFLTRSEGSQPPQFRGCCWDAQSPSPRARGGVVVCRSPTDRGRRRGAPGCTDGRLQTWTWWTVGACHDDMFQHRCQCNCWSFFRRGLWYNLVVFTTSTSKVFFGTTQLYTVFTSFLPHQYLDLGLWSYDSTTFEPTTNLTQISHLLWKLFAPFWTSAVHIDIRNFAARKAPLCGACPATRCVLCCNESIPLILLGGVHNFHLQRLMANHSAWQSLYIFPTSPDFRSRYLKVGIYTFKPTTNQTKFYHLRWKLFARICTCAVDKDLRKVVLHTALLRGDRPATRCLLFWAVCKCAPPFHATLEVNLCTRIFKVYHIYTAWKKTTVCFSMDGKGILGMVLTQGSVAVCLETIGGYYIYGYNRSGSATRLRCAVTAPHGAATRWLPRYAVHAILGCSKREVHVWGGV